MILLQHVFLITHPHPNAISSPPTIFPYCRLHQSFTQGGSVTIQTPGSRFGVYRPVEYSQLLLLPCEYETPSTHHKNAATATIFTNIVELRPPPNYCKKVSHPFRRHTQSSLWITGPTTTEQKHSRVRSEKLFPFTGREWGGGAFQTTFSKKFEKHHQLRERRTTTPVFHPSTSATQKRVANFFVIPPILTPSLWQDL